MSLCQCGHAHGVHVFDGPDSVCAMAGCKCEEFLACAVIEDPYGRRWEIPNVRAFIEEHKDLFLPEDLEHRMTPSRKYDCDFYNRAGQGLYVLQEGYAESWKGWHVHIRKQTPRKKS